jgi:hypothetical protein
VDIPFISGVSIDINDISINEIQPYRYTTPSIPMAPPVVVNIGVPVVNIPGCVEATETNSAKNNQLREDDPNGLVTYCDSGVPSFNPISYEPNQMILTGPPKVDTRSQDSSTIPEFKIPKTKPPVATTDVECPTLSQKAQEPVGTFIQGFRKKVTGYELIDNTCVQITEPVELTTQILAGLPSGGQIAQVGGIAVIATSSALIAKPLADLLLKAVRPAVKKVMKKIAKLRGKSSQVLSTAERRNEQRGRNHAMMSIRHTLKSK